MAKRYALVPEAWLKQKASSSNHIDERAQVKHPSVFDSSTELGQQQPLNPLTKNVSEIEQLLTMIPKTYRHKAEIFLRCVLKNISLDGQQRVIYDEKVDGETVVGSNIIDIIRYFVSPYPSERPLDAPRFRNVIEKSGVPIYVLRDKSKQLTSTSQQIPQKTNHADTIDTTISELGDSPQQRLINSEANDSYPGDSSSPFAWKAFSSHA